MGSDDELHGNEKCCYTGEPFGGEGRSDPTVACTGSRGITHLGPYNKL